VPEQARLHVLAVERLAQQRVVEQVDLADGQVVGGAPVRIEPLGVVGAERLSLQRFGHAPERYSFRRRPVRGAVGPGADRAHDQHRAWRVCRTPVETLPKTARLTAPQPCEPITRNAARTLAPRGRSPRSAGHARRPPGIDAGLLGLRHRSQDEPSRFSSPASRARR
jgi:hypothetical protein